jgi:L-alanine-DL-glutamate epimerase-like enolase superfamily enzyme
VYRYEPYWVEEPTWPPNDYELLGIVVSKSPIPIAAGENEYYIGGFRELARLGLAYIQPDISKVGGLLRFIEVVKAVNGLGKPVAPHHRPHKSILAHTYTLHVASVIDNITLVEWPLAWINEIYDEEVTVRNGEIDITNLVKRKGMGLGIKEEILSKYPYEKKYTPLIFH